ncbi:hypothetical protein LCGC14_0194540 [marine sediment metagenome]|uniref:Uncharacterized protein n=1 Tax=marine sediment metagenome TaxID=412755 RepID=A0A0F9V1M5_9ZZZZ
MFIPQINKENYNILTMIIKSLKLTRKTQVAQYEMLTIEAYFERDEGETQEHFRERAILEMGAIYIRATGKEDPYIVKSEFPSKDDMD